VKHFPLLLLSALLVMGCSAKKTAPVALVSGTPAYQLAKDLSAIDPIFDPDKNASFVTARSFDVTVGDVIEVLWAQYGKMSGQLSGYDAGQLKTNATQLATKIGEQRLFVLAADKAKTPAVTEEALKAALSEQFASAGGEEQVAALFKENDISLDFVKKMISESLYVNDFIEKSLFADVKATDAEIKKAYEADKTATVRHILLLTEGKTDAEKKEIRKKMEGILKRAKANEDFAALAKEFTEDPGSKETGGLYENFPRGQMVKSFEDAAFTVPVGKLSGVVETEYGFHILKVESRQKETLALEEVKATITDEIVNKKKSDSFAKLMESLKKRENFKVATL